MMFGAKNLLPCLATNYFQLLPHHSQFYHHTISNSTTTPFPILPPYHSQFYHHTIPNFTIISKSTIHCLILLLSTTISHSTIYCIFATKKSTIHQLYQLPLILLHSTTISNSTIYCLFATKTTILPYHSQLYHHIQVYHLLPFCYKKNYHTYHIIPNLPITTNSTIY